MVSPMAIPLYELTVPVFSRGFRTLSEILRKGEAHAEAQGWDPAVLTAARLIDDMAPLTAQIQRASDTAKGCVVRLGGAENVPFEDNEVTFADMHHRIDATLAFLANAKAEPMNAAEDHHVSVVTRTRTMNFTGRSYVLTFALPNFFFHVTTAYALLRQRGVPIGKMDFLGPMDVGVRDAEAEAELPVAR